MCQNQVKVVKGFLGQTTAFDKLYVKPEVLVMGQNRKGTEARYIHGDYGKGMWTWYSGHDPEAYSHLVGDAPTDLNKFPNSPGYRLILNNVLLPATNLTATDDSKSTLKVYPNPTGTYVNVTGQESGSHYLIFDVTGKVMQSGTLESENAQLDISQYPIGIYLLQVAGNTVKIVKTK